MKSLSDFLRKFDLFGVSFTFKYKSKEKYTTGLGGIITILFIILIIFIGIYNFIPFYNKKNFTTIYYTLKLAKTERVFFDKSKVAFSIGLNCWIGYDGTKAEDLFDVLHKYIYWDIQDGEWVRKIDLMENHPCTHADFYNDFNKSFDESSLSNYYCLNDLSRAMEGIYTSPVFSYYEFDVVAKNNSKKLLDKIESYLIENDCKLQIYYIDKTIDIDDYENPIKSYLEADFIQLNPTLSIRRNIYFMNQHLFDDDSFISLLSSQNDEETELSSIYSRYEEYSLYQGLNRSSASSDYLNWAKLFFRADTRKIDVKRKYQNIMEFYADASSLLIAFYDILLIIFNCINTFYAELSVSKKIFFFKDLDENNINIQKHSKRVNKLLSIVNKESKELKESKESRYPNFHKQINNNKKRIISPNSNIFSDSSNNVEKNSRKNSSRKSISKIEILSINKFDVRSDSNEQSIDKLKTQKLQTDNISYKKNVDNIYNQRNMLKLNYEQKNKHNIEEIKPINDKGKSIKYDFNIFEIIFTSFCKKCLSKNLELKNNINEKTTNFLDNNLDIVSFVRNQILFDIINETILDEQKKSIINFVCRPIISVNQDVKKNFSEFYQCYEEKDFNKFSEDLLELSNKTKKKDKEKRLINISKNHLKDFFNNS